MDICYILLNKGADATQKDNKEQTPLDYARRKGNEYVVALLTCHNTSVADFTRKERFDIIIILYNYHIINKYRTKLNTSLVNAKRFDLFEEDEIIEYNDVGYIDDNISLTNTRSKPCSRDNVESTKTGGYLGLFTENTDGTRLVITS